MLDDTVSDAIIRDSSIARYQRRFNDIFHFISEQSYKTEEHSTVPWLSADVTGSYMQNRTHI